jgi:membrane associated rhomboid family serine protease
MLNTNWSICHWCGGHCIFNKRSHIKNVVIFTLSLVVIFGLSQFNLVVLDKDFLNAAVAVWLFVVIDTLLFLKSYTHFVQRIAFFHDIRTQALIRLNLVTGLCILTIALQFVLEYKLGGWDELVRVYGTYYIQIKQSNEFWRFILGPFIHSGFAHWIINSSLLLMFLTIASKFTRLKATLFVFILGNVLSHVMTYLLWTKNIGHSDAIVGFSGGVFAVMGVVLTSLIYNPCIAKSIIVSLLLFILLCLGTPALIEGNTSHAAHVVGIITGIIAGRWCCRNEERSE